MKIKYEDHKIQKSGLILIDRINDVIADYQADHYSLTLRQVYYQLVSKALIENTEKSYKRIGDLVNNGRMTGLIDWDAIEDRNRTLRFLQHWKDPQDRIKSAADSYHIDLWEDQPYYIEVWVEKDALIGIVESASESWDVPCFSCRGFTSVTSIKDAAHRIAVNTAAGKTCKILYLGDHDPSGIEMTKDIKRRFTTFGAKVDVDRIALNMSQIEQFNPPPNPAKETDSRFVNYLKEFGTTSWELDAIEPRKLDRLITDTIKSNLDPKLWNEAIDRQEQERKAINELIGETV